MENPVEPTKYLISFIGKKPKEPALRQHNIALDIPPAMQGASDKAVEAFALGFIIGTLKYAGVTDIIIEEE